MSSAAQPWHADVPFHVSFRWPRRRRVWSIVALALAATLGLGMVATARHLAIPAPSGPFAVGRQRLVWTGAASQDGERVVPVQLWYPAIPNTGEKTGYIPNLASIADGMIASGEVSAWETWGLRWVRHHSFDDAEVATPAAGAPHHPLVVLSPGNATNVAFYATIAEDLASRGYVVAGIDHPGQVAAVALPDGSVATYDATAEQAGSDPAVAVQAKVAERVADITFAIDHIRATPSLLGGQIDTDRIAVIGHSNGGIAAAEVCRHQPRVRACANIDGQAAGGPFSSSEAAHAPEQPFLFLTKERQLHPELGRRFESAGAGAYRTVVPAAAHDEFADPALFRPTINPLARRVDRVAQTSRDFLAAFLDVSLRDVPPEALSEIRATTDLYVNAYPLGNKASIPGSE